MVMQNILGQLANLGAVAGAPAKVAPATQQPFKRHLGVQDGLPVAVYGTDALVNGILVAIPLLQWGLIWQTIVPPQQRISWGFGSPATPQNQGYMWFYSMDPGVNFSVGILRLVQANARQTKVLTVLEVDDTALHAALAGAAILPAAAPLLNKNEKVALPEKREFPLVGEDSLLQLWYYPIVISGVVADVCNFSIPVTVYQ